MGEVPFDAAPGSPSGRSHRGHPLSDGERETIRAYTEATQAHLEGASPRTVRPLIEDLVRRAPHEPGFRTLAAHFALMTDDLKAASEHLRVALTLEAGAFRRAKLLLLRARVLGALGEAREADALRVELMAMGGEETKLTRDEAAQDERRPVSRARLRMIVPDVFLIDAALLP